MSMNKLNGILMKSIGGFYYVRCDGIEYECKARGSFRKSGNSPVVGDKVAISVPDEGFASIEEIKPRKISSKDLHLQMLTHLLSFALRLTLSRTLR